MRCEASLDHLITDHVMQ